MAARYARLVQPLAHNHFQMEVQCVGLAQHLVCPNPCRKQWLQHNSKIPLQMLKIIYYRMLTVEALVKILANVLPGTASAPRGYTNMSFSMELRYLVHHATILTPMQSVFGTH